MTKLIALINSLYKGSSLTDPAKWKNRTIKANLIAFLASLIALGAAYGFGIPVTEADLAIIASAVISVVNIIMQMATSEKVGLRPKNGGSPSKPTSDS